MRYNSGMSSAIQKWYKGKALQTIKDYVLPTLALAEEQGYWPKGASRKVKAALNKQTIARSFARAQEESGVLQGISEDRGHTRTYASPPPKISGWDLVSAMLYGSVERAPRLLQLVNQLAPLCINEQEKEALARGRQWIQDFLPIAELVALLDSRRPVPTLVCKTLSPLVLATLGTSLGITLESIESPPIKYTWVTKTTPKGETYQVSLPYIAWPVGTSFDRSKFADNFEHCHACGHRIKNVFNWVPLLGQIKGPIGPGPTALWVGRDCAKKLFGCEVEGEALWGEAKTRPV
jgi:hypothetical protein